MLRNPRDIKHELTQVCSVTIPLIKRITWPPVKPMMDKHVGRREIVRNISKKHPKPVFKEMAYIVPYPFLIQAVIMALMKKTKQLQASVKRREVR